MESAKFVITTIRLQSIITSGQRRGTRATGFTGFVGLAISPIMAKSRTVFIPAVVIAGAVSSRSSVCIGGEKMKNSAADNPMCAMCRKLGQRGYRKGRYKNCPGTCKALEAYELLESTNKKR